MKLKARIKSMFERRRRGAVALLAVVALVPMSAMISASVNTGQSFEDRRRSQDAADAMALAHATWSARSLNTIAMNNVTISQLLTVAIGSEALEATIWEFYATVSNINDFVDRQNRYCQALNALWFIGGTAAAEACENWNDGFVRTPANLARIFVGTFIHARYQPMWSAFTAQQALRAMDDMNEEIVARFPDTIRQIAADYAELFDVDGFHFVEPCALEGQCYDRPGTGMSLPIERNAFLERYELCEGMFRGSSSRIPTVSIRSSFEARGFSNGTGPMTEGGNIRDHIEEQTDIDNVLRLTDFYYDYFPLAFTLPLFRRVPARDALQGTQETGDNTFTRSFDSKLAALCYPVYGEPHTFSGYNRQALLAPLLAIIPSRPTTFSPIGATRNFTPPTRPEDMAPEYRVLTIVQTEPAEHLGNEVPPFSGTGSDRQFAVEVLNSKPMHHFAHAEATIFNPDGGDLYTQNWRTRLTPATRMDAPRDIAADLREHAPGAFSDLARALDAVQSTTGWSQINAH